MPHHTIWWGFFLSTKLKIYILVLIKINITMAKTKYKGIYAYKDTNTNEIIYIGKDSQMYKKARHTQHHSKPRYDVQKINRILQSNVGRYEYLEIIRLPPTTTSEELDKFEIRYINLYSPKFNFTIGGDGAPTNKGKKFTKEHRAKISYANRGKQHSDETKQKISENNARYFLGKHRPKETKQKISETMKGRPLSLDHKLALSKAGNKSGYYRVYKRYDDRFKQGFVWIYKWREHGKMRSLSSVNLLKLKSKVIEKGLPWIRLSEIKA